MPSGLPRLSAVVSAADHHTPPNRLRVLFESSRVQNGYNLRNDKQTSCLAAIAGSYLSARASWGMGVVTTSGSSSMKGSDIFGFAAGLPLSAAICPNTEIEERRTTESVHEVHGSMI